MEKEYQVVTLADGTKWFVLSEETYDGGLYRYVVELDDEDERTDTFKVMRVYNQDGQEFFGFIEDQELLKQIIPLLVPGSKEYIENPEKVNELME